MDRIRNDNDNDNGRAGRAYRTARRVLAAVLLAVLAGFVRAPAAVAMPPAAGAGPSAGAGAAAAVPGARWQWPLAGTPQVLRGFEPPPGPYAAGHRGVDLAAPVGAAVLAAGAGVVGYAGMLAGRGVVTVVHGGLRTTYEPVTATVHPGQPVAPGTVLGHLQAGTHCGLLRPCLHWGLLRGRVYLDPLALLGLAAVRLLPVWDTARATGGASGNAVGGAAGSATGRAEGSATGRAEGSATGRAAGSATSRAAADSAGRTAGDPANRAGRAAGPIVGPLTALKRHGAATAPDPDPATSGRAGDSQPSTRASSSAALPRDDRGHGAAGGLVLTLVLLAGCALLPTRRPGQLGSVSRSGR